MQVKDTGIVTVECSALSSVVALDQKDLKERIFVRIRPDLERIEAEINRQLTSSIPFISTVGRYIMGSGGKRLRPLLMILCARLCGYQGTQDATLSTVFEFLHAASLLHDDVVDHAEIRRSKPAANTVWGNPAVVLVGDFLYSKSILMTVAHDDIRMLEVLSSTTTKMAEGEVLQLINADNLELDEKEYLEVITRKTAVLISAACQIGAIFGGAAQEQEQALHSYGHHLGIAFQLVDDTLDYTGDASELGKPVGNDIQEGKITLPLIYALRNGKSHERDRLKELFSTETLRGEEVEAVRDLVCRIGGIGYTQQLAVDHIHRAKKAVALFPDHPTRDLLQDIADYVFCRRT